MARILLVRRKEPRQEVAFRVLASMLERLKGLLGTDGSTQPVALLRCSSIHTFGMRYRIDVAFVDIGGLVVASWRSVPPGRVLSNKHGYIALERPHERTPWLVEGEQIEMERITEDTQLLGVSVESPPSDAAP